MPSIRKCRPSSAGLSGGSGKLRWRAPAYPGMPDPGGNAAMRKAYSVYWPRRRWRPAAACARCRARSCSADLRLRQGAAAGPSHQRRRPPPPLDQRAGHLPAGRILHGRPASYPGRIAQRADSPVPGHASPAHVRSHPHSLLTTNPAALHRRSHRGMRMVPRSIQSDRRRRADRLITVPRTGNSLPLFSVRGPVSSCRWVVRSCVVGSTRRRYRTAPRRERGRSRFHTTGGASSNARAGR